MKYYFIATYLPEIQRGDHRLPFSLADLLEHKERIAPEDWREVELILLRRDVAILESLLAGRMIDMPYALFGVEFWREEIQNPHKGPAFLTKFLKTVDRTAFGAAEIDRLFGVYYDEVQHTSASPFLKAYFTFEKNLRNLLAALRARRLGREVSGCVLGEGEWTEQLITSGARDFGLGRDFPWVEPLLSLSDPALLNDTMESLLWDFCETQAGPDPFHFDIILAYVLRLEMVEARIRQDVARGLNRVRQLEETDYAR